MAETTYVVSATAKSVLNIVNNLSARLPITFTPNVQTTLNTKYGINAAVLPTSVTKHRYFGIGIGGKYNTSDDNLSAAYKPSNAEMDLYKPIPFRCLAEDEDDALTASERSKYRLRVPKIINGKKYYCYYLKLLEFTDNIYLRYIDPSTQEELTYTIDTSNLNPTGKVPSTSGTVDATITDISAYSVANAIITGSEVLEAINIMYGGDLRYAFISELAVYSGEEKVVSALNSQSVEFSYTEAMYIQMSSKNTWNGIDMAQSSITETREIRFAEGSILILSS